MRPWIATAATTVLLFLLGTVQPLAGAEESPFPLFGEVASRTHSGLAVRKEPPKVSAFSYDLGERICGVANGSRFVASGQQLVANGEVWYHVDVTEVTRSLGETPCPDPPFSGWMVARTTRSSVVEVLQRNVPPMPRAAATGDRVADAGSIEPESDPSTLAFLVKYLLLVLGTAVGVAVISMEKERAVWPPTWLSGIVWLELVVLSATNVLFVVLLVDSKYVASDASALADGEAGPLFALVKLFDAAPGGFVVLGFILTATWMKFMSFAGER